MSNPSRSPAPTGRAHLTADCTHCAALCCTALGFARSADFPADKPAGEPCTHLDRDHTCTVHSSLRARGYRGCTTFDCFGAGQAVSRRATAPRHTVFAAFAVARQLHEMLWHLTEARLRSLDPDAAGAAAALESTITTLTAADANALASTETTTLHAEVRAVLMDVSDQIRASWFADRDPHPDLHPGADLAGRDLRRHVGCGADLRGACLIAADLRGVDLTGADLLGTDLRDARVHGADLSRALYLTRPQVNSALGDAATLLPADIPAPEHWRAAPGG